MKVTRELLDASAALSHRAAFHGIDPTRLALAADIRARAAELQSLRVGSELDAAQVAYLQALRSRLNDFCIATLTVAQDWQDAFGNAYAGKGE